MCICTQDCWLKEFFFSGDWSFVEKEGSRERIFDVLYAMLTFAKSWGIVRRSKVIDSCAFSPAQGMKVVAILLFVRLYLCFHVSTEVYVDKEFL